MKLYQAVRLYIQSRENILAAGTMKNDRVYLLRSFCGFMPDQDITTITTDDLRDYREFLFARDTKYTTRTGLTRKPVKGKLSVMTVRSMLFCLRTFFNWLVNENHLVASPARRLEIPAMPDQPPKAISDNDLQQMLQTVQAETSVTRRSRNLALVLFLRDTGCRAGGVSGLKIENLSLDKRSAIVTEKGKGGKTRVVYFTEQTRVALDEWLKVHPAFALRRAVREQGTRDELQVEHVFVSERYPYPRMERATIYCVLTALRFKAGVTGRANPHSFRHRRARKFLENGASLGLTSRLMGHADIGITNKFYGVYAEGELQSGYDQFAEK